MIPEEGSEIPQSHPPEHWHFRMRFSVGTEQKLAPMSSGFTTSSFLKSSPALRTALMSNRIVFFPVLRNGFTSNR